MLKRNSKAIAFVMAFAICLTVIAPFFAVAPAAAASTYSVLKTETVSTTGGYLSSVKIEIDIANMAAMTAGDVVTLHLPKGLKFDNTAGTIVAQEYNNPRVTFRAASVAGNAQLTTCVDSSIAYTDVDASGTVNTGDTGYGTSGAATFNAGVANGGSSPSGAANVIVEAPASIDANNFNAFDQAGAFAAYAVGENTVDIKYASNTAGRTLGRLYVTLNKVLVTDSFDGDIKVNFIAPSNSGFSSAMALTIAKYVSSSKGTTSMAKSVVTMGSGGVALDTFMIQEAVKGALKANEVITLDLPSGFKWNVAAASVKGAWGYSAPIFPAAGLGTTANTAGNFWTNGSDKLYVKMPAALGAASEGRIYISDASVVIEDDNVAKKGDVSLNVSSDLGNVTDQDVVVATYADYSVTVTEDAVKEVVAGRDNTELGSFKITEGLAGSILLNRTIDLTLPAGVKWQNAPTLAPGTWPTSGSAAAFVDEGLSGNLDTIIAIAAGTTPTNNGRTLKITLTPVAGVTYTKSSVLFKKLNVTIAPDFSGDLKVEIGGTAGVTGSVKVATVKPAVEISNDKSAKIIIGSQAQKAGDILIKEGKKEAIKAGNIVLALPNGAFWASKPAVEVTEGDYTVDSWTIDDELLTIKTKSTSSKPSTIKISDVKVTTNRTVPEGDFKVSVKGWTNNAIQSTALTDNLAAAQFTNADIVSTVIGQCITPAPSEGTTGAAAGQFKINSNIYEVNGVAKVMDAAPYIKAGRTYVPVKFLGLALGVAEKDIVWDATAQKATLTLGDKKVELTIGSTSYTVNGEAKTMDVAPEINNGRTMLPAKYVAEGLGFQVGWDASTGTVLVSK